MDRLFERPTNRHDLSDTLHTTTEQLAHAAELFEVPARNLDDNVVETRLKACTGHLRDGVLDFVERDAKAQFRCDEGKGITRSF